MWRSTFWGYRGRFDFLASDLMVASWGDVSAAGRDSPRRATYFSLLRQRKVGKRKAAPLAASLRFAAGNLRCSRSGCAAELTARRSRSVQTAAASQITMQTHASLRSLTPPAVLLGASRGGGKTRPSAAMARGDFQIPSGRAEKRRVWGGRGSAACRASCSDSLRLFERRERSEQSEFRSAASRLSIAGCPAAKRRGHGQRGRLFLCLLSFWRGKKKVGAPPGAHPGQQLFAYP